ncbi:MAG: hypothetical protein JXB32_00780 [Deltaproteobacteria bacterium]|nr:hypothetical protein [Deltaproteobacteria bacterium]
MRTLTRHVFVGALWRLLALAGLAAALGALVGLVEAGNRPAAAQAIGWLGALSRVPEVVFFAAPLWCLLGIAWTARDLVPPGVAEGLGGAGVPERRVDLAILWALVVALAATAGLGGWVAPWVQQELTAQREEAWARSGGTPDWTRSGRVWIRSDGRLLRVEASGDEVRVTRGLEPGPGGPRELRGAELAAGEAPSAATLALLSTPPALQTVPDLLAAGAVRSHHGHLPAPVHSELALRGTVVALLVPAGATGLACRRMRRAARRWAFAAALAAAGLLGVQATHVFATRGELGAGWVAMLPLALAGAVAALAWRWRGRG